MANALSHRSTNNWREFRKWFLNSRGSAEIRSLNLTPLQGSQKSVRNGLQSGTMLSLTWHNQLVRLTEGSTQHRCARQTLTVMLTWRGRWV